MTVKHKANYQELLSASLIVNEKKGDAKQAIERCHQSFAELSKKISQIVAQSWLPEGAEIKKVLLQGNSQEIGAMFKENGADIEAFFKPFNVYFNVDWDTFYGSLVEVSTGDNIWLSNIPYPPRPMEVTDEQLEEWVNNDDPDVLYPPHPYIPLTCS